jgi:DNA mismatch repair protein MutL
MGSIRLLPDILASQVAAGEVVERPASVVKELVENSIDAGARRILVEFQKGGVRLIRVTDDGCGMDRTDALLCLERHATSKIRESADLAAITTMGFRGEALPSIASVSRFRLSTRRHGDEEGKSGTLIEVEGGVVRSVTDSGDASGTRIEVSDLFFNVPARRKFLRGEQTEAANLLAQIEPLAVAHPDIAFTCIRDAREVFRLAATDDLAVRLRDLHGGEFLSRMLPVPAIEHEGIAVSGWIAAPGEGRSDRSLQMTFVNGRIVRSPVLSMPLREACEGVLPKGLHPPAVLFFTLDPAAVDCNVHPAKREVRFRDPSLLREAALRAARSAWGGGAGGAVAMELGPGADPLFPPLVARPSVLRSPGYALQGELPAARIREARPTHELVPDGHLGEGSGEPSSGISSPAYLASLTGRYLLFEQEEGLLLLEVRAARERILFERALGRIETGEAVESQRLLIPETLEVSPAEVAWIEARREILAIAGLSVEPFGSTSLKVDAVPAGAVHLATSEILRGLLDDLKDLPGSPVLDARGREALAASVGRLAAAGAALPAGEDAATRLMKELFSCRMPYSTPTGRPTLSQIAPSELKRRFQA